MSCPTGSREGFACSGRGYGAPEMARPTEDTMRHVGRSSVHLLVLGLVLLAGAWPVAAQTPGVTATDIKIGNINPYSGPASAYGTIGKVIGAYFKKVSDEGGINGRKITYITYDDAYSPPKAVEMA